MTQNFSRNKTRQDYNNPARRETRRRAVEVRGEPRQHGFFTVSRVFNPNPRDFDEQQRSLCQENNLPTSPLYTFKCKVPAMQNYSENFFLLIFLHHLIECELLITKNNFLPYANIFFRSKSTKNLKDVRFFKKHIFSKTCHMFCFLLFLCF
jgi:hypothetical protein